jgi:translation initiation factor 2B subunit (eIF-2B alpha/beta/delta family)
MNYSQAQDEFLRELSEDRRRGAGELARRCLEMLAECAAQLPASAPEELHEDLRRLAEELMRTRPSMAPIKTLLERWLQTLAKNPEEKLKEFRTRAAEEAGRLSEFSLQAAARAAGCASEAIGEGQTVITHGYSSTIAEVFRLLRNKDVMAIVSEARPLLEGWRLAKRLQQWGIPTTCITDAQIGLFVELADVALVGADSVLADGSLVNKAGTRLLALAARECEAPFYVCCESFKRSSAPPGEFELEEKEAKELGFPEKLGVRVRNIYFDVTPPRLISGWISEEGIRTVY